MELARRDGKIYEFGGFRLIPGEELLLRSGEPVALNPKALRVLALLVERHGHLVTKPEIIDSVWDDSFVEEGSLAKAIWMIRHALAESSSGRFIQTIPRRGYRFVFPVTVVTNGSGAFRLDLVGVDGIPSQTEEQVTNVQSGRQMKRLGGSDDIADLERTSPAKPTGTRKLRRSAVYIGAGVFLLAAVSTYLGFFRAFGSRTDHLRDRGTTNEDAYQLYQQAENLSHGRLQQNMSAAMDDLNQALALDPKFARAWAAKALLNAYLATYPGADQTEQYKKSMDALEKARAIDPNLPEAYSALCLNKFRYEYDIAGAESACRRAIELDDNSAVAHVEYAYFLYSRGRFDESIAETKRAIDLESLSYVFQQRYAQALHFARRYEEEEAQLKRLIELNPTHTNLYTRLYTNLALQGKDDKAFDCLIQKLTLDKADNETVERFRTSYAASGWRGVTLERIKRPELEGAETFHVACLYASLGDKDKAFEYLERAYKQRSYKIAVLQVEPQLDPLHDDPRWAELVGRVEGK